MSPPKPGGLPPELLDAAVQLMGRSGRQGTVRVQGRSMVPTFREGQLLAVEFAPDRPRCGDVLVFRNDDFLVVHRLVGRARSRGAHELLRTRGDGLPHFDPPVRLASVVARVLAVESTDGWRDLRSRRARIYARGLAGHDFFWGCQTVLARLLERGLARLGLQLPLRRTVAALDRGLLLVAHGIGFRVFHGRTPPPG